MPTISLHVVMQIEMASFLSSPTIPTLYKEVEGFILLHPSLQSTNYLAASHSFMQSFERAS